MVTAEFEEIMSNETFWDDYQHINQCCGYFGRNKTSYQCVHNQYDCGIQFAVYIGAYMEWFDKYFLLLILLFSGACCLFIVLSAFHM